MKKYILLTLLASTFMTSAYSQTQVGVAGSIVGSPISRPVSTTERVLKIGNDITSDEKISTGENDRAQLVLASVENGTGQQVAMASVAASGVGAAPNVIPIEGAVERVAVGGESGATGIIAQTSQVLNAKNVDNSIYNAVNSLSHV